METLTRTTLVPGSTSGDRLALHLAFAEHPEGIARDTALDERGLTIGRAPEADGPLLRLPADGWASRTHARIRWTPEGLLVEDLGARNGTRVDGVRISGTAWLAPGQVLQVGSAVFVLGPAVDDDLPSPPPDFACRNAGMRDLWRRILRLAESDAGVLILGELGTGKTRIARLIHTLGPRAHRPFVAHNCSALPRNLEEAILFGVVGGFIPTVKAQEGLLTRAGDGTLFLDELAELPEPAQAKLLDAFDPTAPSYLPVGDTRRLATRCRLITATNRNVFELAGSGALRHDLLSRLAVGQLLVPPLRTRREDILPLFEAALARAGVREPVVTRAEVATTLLVARWSENVRGLETLAQRVALGEVLDPPLILAHAERGLAEPLPATPTGLRAVPTTPSWPPNPAELLELLARHRWEIKAAAEAIGRRRETLSRLVSATFGGREEVARAWQVYQATGKVPPR